MIEPTIGRVVWVRNRQGRMHDQPETAQICFVHSKTLVNVGGFDHVGHPFRCVNIPLDQGPPTVLMQGEQYCEWMPFQKGQAQKTEALESKLNDAAKVKAPVTA